MQPDYVNSGTETSPSLPVSLANFITVWAWEEKKNPNPKETHSTLITKPRQLDKMPEAFLIYSWPKLNAGTLQQAGHNVNKHLHHQQFQQGVCSLLRASNPSEHGEHYTQGRRNSALI